MSSSEQLPLLNIIDHQPGAYAMPEPPSPRTGPGPGKYNATPDEPLAIGDKVQVLPFYDQWNLPRGSFAEAVVTAIAADRITLAIPGVSTRQGYVCGIERIRKL